MSQTHREDELRDHVQQSQAFEAWSTYGIRGMVKLDVVGRLARILDHCMGLDVKTACSDVGRLPQDRACRSRLLTRILPHRQIASSRGTQLSEISPRGFGKADLRRFHRDGLHSRSLERTSGRVTRKQSNARSCATLCRSCLQCGQRSLAEPPRVPSPASIRD